MTGKIFCNFPSRHKFDGPNAGARFRIIAREKPHSPGTMNRFPLIAASLVLAIAGVVVWIGTMTDHRQPTTSNIHRRLAPFQASVPAGMPTLKRQPMMAKSTSQAETSIARLNVTSMDPTQQENCRKVEVEAHRSLAKLSDTVSLSTTQKPLVFQILVRSAGDFHPSMLVAGTPAGELTESAADAICEVLNPSQEAAFQETLLDDAAWWEDAIAQMEAGLDETAPGISETPLIDVEP